MRYFWGIGAVVLYYVGSNLLFGYVSPTMIMFGLPCPGCGLSRAGWLFLSGSFMESFRMHPLLVPTMAFIAVAAGVRVFLPEKIKILQTPAIILLIVFLVVYVFRMVSLFPHHPPMVINGDSLLHRIIFALR